MTQAVVGIGSNSAPHERVGQALEHLENSFGALRVSPVYRGPAVGRSGQDFLNLVASFQTDDGLDSVYTRLRAIEAVCGRDRAHAQAQMPMDIDLLLFGNLRREAAPQLPRRDILEQAFVLCPLADLLPEARHPVCKRSYAALWQDFNAGAAALEMVTLEAGRAPHTS